MTDHDTLDDLIDQMLAIMQKHIDSLPIEQQVEVRMRERALLERIQRERDYPN